jgi:hypothetical protein
MAYALMARVLRILADSRGLAIRQLGEALMSEDERMAKARKKERLDRAIEQVCALISIDDF